ncbi:DUF4097 family beta strand repeat protein [Streptomyces kaniharaensis]|uniref:DUF4097 family beta strand repeat protein n=1 Tax=Streptomyces kaniharaensis TaxID=212423 RepID=A0A6N7L4G7_9ACTN|nr:DUF4097 family beta strand repeat-containing protein [Streptomyces kaniharaensis]MQS17769.1 DUF4097 family beta strand repeat protein [Streptomyces kaniharaensis]
MGRQRRYIGALVIAGIAVGGLSACSPRTEFSDDATVTEKVTAVRLDTSAGSVTVHGKAGATQIAVHRTIGYEHDRPGATTRLENGVLVLGGCGDDCSASYTVEIPAGLPITGETSAGEISLSQVGEVSVRTSSGSITLDGVAGPVDVHTSNGAIEGTGLQGDRIRAQTSNGRIRLTPGKAQDVTAKTSNGAITLTVPAAAYHVITSNSSGDIHVGVPDDPAGRYRLDLGTSNGGITVRTG